MSATHSPTASASCDAHLLTELPAELVSSILGHLHSPRDAAACALTCHRMHAGVQEAPLKLRVGLVGDGGTVPLNHSLHGLPMSFPGLVELDLSGCLAGDEGVQGVLAKLPFLRVLRLSSCRKLSQAFVQGAFPLPLPGDLSRFPAFKSSAAQQACQQTSQPGSIQREATRAFAQKGSGTVSRLGRTEHHPQDNDHPEGGEASPSNFGGATLASTGMGLCILALNNCVRLAPEGMRAIASSCPQLEHLFLGGTTIITPHSSAAVVGPPALVQNNSQSFPGLMAEGSPRASQVSALRSMMDAIRGIAPADSGGVHIQVATELAGMVSKLPCLQTLELTFASAGILDTLRASTAVQEREGLRIWDFCSLDCLLDAKKLLHAWDRGDAGPQANQLHPDLVMAISAAVNCSSRAKHTPLHLAAIDGCVQEAQELLALGASLDPADRNGSTPLFLACEQGQAGTAALLLGAGACPCAQNRAEERPLYIASLRGHAAVVSELLRAMQSRGLPWQEPEGYSKGWAPLLAASLSDRLQVASILLDAAGSPGHRAAMVTATNIYGQGSLHTAARRGNQPMLQLLLEHARPVALLARDKKGDTPISLARSAGHFQVAVNLEAHVHGKPAFCSVPQRVQAVAIPRTPQPRRLPHHSEGMHGPRSRRKNGLR
ncbi:hypothetical protein WJX74_005178 [Apatococcus lobatus]|uniref:F-box domain-containing protein n=1 Tax=Apatococcus lobatus TaxID=904363 RepID=A0AAW1RD94_9CHLO